MKLKIGVVGMGGIGHTHARCYEADPLSEVVAVCDMVKEKADKAADAFKAKPFYTIKDMLKSGIKLDACSVCTAGAENGGDHYKPTMELLRGGMPVLGEKPISNRLDEGRKMVALAKRKRLPYGINLNHRFTPAALRAKGWLDEGRLGMLHIVKMTLWINNPNESSPWFHLRALHPHSIDILRYFGGPIKSVHAFLMKGKGRKIWSNAQVNFLFKNKSIGHLTGSYDAGGTYGLETLEIVGSDGRVVITNACEDLYWYPRRGIEREHYSHLGGMQGFGDTFGSRIHRWLEQLRDGDAPSKIEASGAEALAAQTAIEAAIKSWEEHCVVDV